MWPLLFCTLCSGLTQGGVHGKKQWVHGALLGPRGPHKDTKGTWAQTNAINALVSKMAQPMQPLCKICPTNAKPAKHILQLFCNGWTPRGLLAALGRRDGLLSDLGIHLGTLLGPPNHPNSSCNSSENRVALLNDISSYLEASGGPFWVDLGPLWGIGSKTDPKQLAAPTVL